MIDGSVQKARRFARFVYWIAGATVAGLLVLWLAYGFLQGTNLAVVADALGIVWLVVFGSLPVLAFIWIARFASLASTAPELRTPRLVMVGLIVVWAMLVAGFVALIYYLVKGLLNFL
jgi:hypothetical protein